MKHRLSDLCIAWIFIVTINTSHVLTSHPDIYDVRVVDDVDEIDEETTLECHQREYTYEVSKPHITELGDVLECSDLVTVTSCWGRCDSSEIADYKIPYKVSRHPVCTYSGRQSRIVRLENCHPDHPDPTYEVFDAVGCVCEPCDPRDTSCEHLNG